MRYVFSVGSGIYEDERIDDLSFAANDAESFYSLALDSSLGNASRESSTLLLNPTRKELKTKLGEFLSRMTPDDVFIIYFAGHAGRMTSGKWTFFCKDTRKDVLSLTSFSYTDLQALLDQYKRRKGILIFDACYARSVTELQKEVKARGGVDNMIHSPHTEGISILWACGSMDLAFEKSGHGLFTGLLIEAIKSGSELPPDRRYLMSQDAIQWIKSRLRQSDYPRDFWPGFRSMGDIDEIYLSLNPNYNEGGKKSDTCKKETPEKSVDLDELIEQISEDLGFTDTPGPTKELTLLKQLLGEVHDRNALYAMKERKDIRIISINRFSLIWQWIKIVIIAPIVLAMFIGHYFGESAGFISLGIGVLLMFLIDLVDNWDKMMRPEDYFIIVSENGFIDVRGRNKSGKNSLMMPWALVHKMNRETRTKNGYTKSDKLTIFFKNRKKLTLLNISDKSISYPKDMMDQFKRGELCYDASDYSMPGGIKKLDQVLNWGKALRFNKWRLYEQEDADDDERVVQSAKKPFASPVFFLTGTGDYQADSRLEPLRGYDKDLERMKNIFENDNPSEALNILKNPSIEEFERMLVKIFSEASRRNLVFYFTGHGIVKDRELYLAVKDTHTEQLMESAFPVRKLADLLVETQLQHLVLILDCCFSGAGGKNMGVSIDKDTNLADLFSQEKENLTIIAATGSEEMAYELGSGSIFTNAFTTAVKRSLKKRKDVTVQELNKELKKQMAGFGIKQSHHTFASDTGLSFALLHYKKRETITGTEVGTKLSQNMKNLSENQSDTLKELANRFRRGIEETHNHISDSYFFNDNPGSIGWGDVRLVFLFGFFTFFWTGWINMTLGLIVAIIAIAFSFYWLSRNRWKRYLALTKDGIVLWSRRDTEVFPASEILEAVLEETSTQLGHSEELKNMLIYLKMRNSEKILLLESNHRWNIAFPELYRMVSEFCEIYNQKTKAYGKEQLNEEFHSLKQRRTD